MLVIKNTVFYLFLFLFFVTFNERIIPLTIISFSDELFLLIATLIIFIDMTVQVTTQKIHKIHFVLLLYLFYQIINLYTSPFHLKIEYVLIQSFINIKAFIVPLAILLILEKTRTNYLIIKRLLFIFSILFLFGMVANFVLQGNWNLMMGNDKIEYRYGFIRPTGWLGAAHLNAYFFGLTFVNIYLLYNKTITVKVSDFVKKFFIFIIIDFLIAFPLTVRKGMIMNIPFGFTVFGLFKGGRKIIFSYFAIIFVLAFLLIIKDTEMMADTVRDIAATTNNNSDNLYIRGLMIYNGYSLFLEFFPVGAGAATFGTVLSQYNTLEVYRHVGLSEYWFSEDGLVGVFDSGLFSMLAENGFIGMLLMSLFIYYFFKFNKNRLDSNNYIIFKMLTWFAILLSFTEPVWQNGMFTVFYTVNILFIYSKNNIYRENGRWVKYEPL
ncbi:MAG: hypothetical protein WC856_08270 [Methylococcaceae bacterium]|jgi:hypothetical protein